MIRDREAGKRVISTKYLSIFSFIFNVSFLSTRIKSINIFLFEQISKRFDANEKYESNFPESICQVSWHLHNFHSRRFQKETINRFCFDSIYEWIILAKTRSLSIINLHYLPFFPRVLQYTYFTSK